MINAILAATAQGVIGNRGTLPWPKNPEDLAWFKNTTTNHVVVMGRNTWDDPKMPKPLPNRINYVFSHRSVGVSARQLLGDPAELVQNLKSKHSDKEIFIIGGKNLYEATIDVVDQIYLTRIKENYWGDTRLNLDRFLNGFRLMTVRPGESCTYEIWRRRY